MNSPLAQLLLLTVFVGIGLWVGVKWFLGGTEEFPDSIDIRSMGYLRDDAPTSGTSASAPKELEPANQEPMPPAAFAAPEPMKTVEEISEEAAAEEEQAEEEETDEMEPDTVALGAEEVDAREKARKRRLAELGLIPRQRPEPTIAVDVSLIMPDSCIDAAIAKVPVGLKFRYESSIIRGESLNALESMVALYRDCQQGEFVLTENPLGREDATDTLTQMRFDEVKYFFIQHSVPIDAVQFPEKE